MRRNNRRGYRNTEQSFRLLLPWPPLIPRGPVAGATGAHLFAVVTAQLIGLSPLAIKSGNDLLSWRIVFGRAFFHGGPLT
jgi:hypothetical protein